MMQDFSSAALFSFFLLQVVAGPPPPPVNEVVAAVSRNVKEFQEFLPDFVCNERITSATFESGRVQKRRVVASIFSAGQKRSAQREIVAIDEKPARKNAKMPDLPITFDVSFTGILYATFSPGMLQAHDYALAEKPEAAGRLVVEFTTKKDQQELKWTLDDQKLVARDAGKAWIDTASMQAVRIERNFLNLPRALTRIVMTVDYGPVTIGERQFWLPQTFRTELTERDPKITGMFLAEYTNCKKFVTEIRILP